MKCQRDTSGWIKFFGTGTKLVVSESNLNSKSDFVLKQKLLVHQDNDTRAVQYFTKGFAHCDTSSGARFKVFGSGTELIVTETEAKINLSKIRILPPLTEKDGKVTHICLIEDFYPNVIKVTWEDDKKNAEKNAVHGEIWPPGDNHTSYSVSSWLTADKNSGKNYICKYQHESKEASVPIESQGAAAVPQTTAGCTNQLFTVSFIHRTAYLVYIILLLKSTMYYVVILFFMYRMQSPLKQQEKKT